MKYSNIDMIFIENWQRKTNYMNVNRKNEKS